MRYTLLISIIIFFSCEKATKTEITKQPQLIPDLKTSADTITNGGILKFKGYLKFDPELDSTKDLWNIVNKFELKFDSSSNSAFKQNALVTAELRGDTAYGQFMIFYPNSDSLPDYFKHTWNASLNVSFKTETKHSVDTVYSQRFTVVVKK